MPLDFNEIRQLLATIAQTDIAELTLKGDNFELTVRKAVGVSNQLLPDAGLVSPGSIVNSGLTSTSPTASQVSSGAELETFTSRVVDNSVMRLPVTTPPPIEQRLVDVVSPMVGTFYRAPAPGEPSFAEVGDRIRVGQTICIIEAMKLMNEIEAEVSGQVMEILLQNGEPVEYGQPLIRIKPE